MDGNEGSAAPRADVLAHLRRFLGPSPGALAVSGLFEVHVFGPTQTRPWLTVATLGLSEVGLAPPQDEPDRRYQELLLYLPVDWDTASPDSRARWPVDLLLDLASRVAEEGTAPVPGRSIAPQWPPKPFAPNTLLSAAVFNRPGREEREHPEFDPLFVGTHAVSFLWVIPITTAENALLVNEGYNVLLERMADARVPYEVDIARACVVTGRRPAAPQAEPPDAAPAPPRAPVPGDDVREEEATTEPRRRRRFGR